jgi:hypothetical protein
MPVERLAMVAEVMDKEPSAALVAVAGAILAVAGFVAGRYKPKLLFFVVPLGVAAVLAALSEIRDPFVALAIRAEAGTPYVLLTYLSIALVLVAPIAGLWFRHHQRA